MFDLTRKELSEALEKESKKRLEDRGLENKNLESLNLALTSFSKSLEMLLSPMCHACSQPIVQAKTMREVTCLCPCHIYIEEI